MDDLEFLVLLPQRLELVEVLCLLPTQLYIWVLDLLSWGVWFILSSGLPIQPSEPVACAY